MSHDDFNFEPVRGLPETLPADEHILWQGGPDAWRLAIEVLWIRWVAGYFAVLAIWRVGVSSTGLPLGEALLHGVPFVLLGALACLVLLGIARAMARTTVYTLTNKRVAMRIGVALTMTLNLPYTWIGSADADIRPGGSGTLAFDLLGETRFSYLMTWPHVRPWRMGRTRPAFRCIPDAARVARLFAEAADARVAVPRVEYTPVGAIAAE
ncbi:PH domain-containing protein [Jannaschia sp. S6380]|uniref:photosynthetic complex putative assembly protein PuhB n=1 Tax=Jannaschia sp. S6380 TaxID=2926408 RepID=UPI001FF3A840|nr:photosynthetic complex putative assembly protein PuhB [Jannaschia sp. S6380]MCK0167655.1 PH domain-containing protein [Jannaschia sp. S6380]